MKKESELALCDSVDSNSNPSDASLGATQYRRGIRKALMDFAIAIPICIATLPLQAAIAAEVKLEDGGPVFYDDRRFHRIDIAEDSNSPSEYISKATEQHGGLTGDIIRLRKFRTMKVDANLMQVDPHLKGTALDPRLTHVGKILRWLNVDELPQFWDILKGKLSFVGLRPIRPEEAAEIAHRVDAHLWIKVFNQGKPGLLHPRAAIDGEHRKYNDGVLRFHPDIFYGRNASFGLDLYLIVRAIMGKRRVVPTPIRPPFS